MEKTAAATRDSLAVEVGRFRPDMWLALECVALCFVTRLVLGLLPAIRFSRPSIVGALANNSSRVGRRVGRLQRFTAAAQAGLAVPLLVISGLQLDQARVTALTDLGFSPAGLCGSGLVSARRCRTAGALDGRGDRFRGGDAGGHSVGTPRRQSAPEMEAMRAD